MHFPSFPCRVEIILNEEMIESPRTWLRKVTDFFGVSDQNHLDELSNWFLQNSAKEINRSTHVAFLYPGSYLTELDPQTIVQLLDLLKEDRFRPLLRHSGYF